jgi:alginate O-acetyltransferase complex protein AlgI
MLFTSLWFGAFFVAVLAAYFLLGRWWRWQNIVLLVASYVSYGFWDRRFLILLFAMTLINYLAGWAISRQSGEGSLFRKRVFLGLALAFDLGILGTFKYFNFFYRSLVDLMNYFGMNQVPLPVNIILPLGLSFFTFIAITYPFDIYRGKIQHTDRFQDYALLVAFFPTMVSGPVERASHLLPQFQSPRQVTSEKVNEGLWLIAWGFFQKLVIADNVAVIANQVYNNYSQYQGLDIVIAIAAYTIEILADFGGYTDIARGVARLFGFDLLLNFNVPYFSLNPSEFWSRWHISLSTWFRDYLYIPMGGNRKGNFRTSVNLFITMVLVGLWHGAAWTFIIWGAWHGLLLIIYQFLGKSWHSSDRTIRGWRSILSIVGRAALMLVLVAAGWTVFRATSLEQAGYFFAHLGVSSSASTLNWAWQLFYFTLPMAVVQYFQFRAQTPVFITRLNPWARGATYGFLTITMLIFAQREISRFIYQGF